MQTLILILAATAMLVGSTYYTITAEKGVARLLTILSAIVCTPACLLTISTITTKLF
jgi:hypothetical protein